MGKNTIQEEWRPVVGFEGRYDVSNFGRVRSLDSVRVGRVRNIYSKPERILRPIRQRQGYLQVHLVAKDGSRRHHFIHRLVADAFIPNVHKHPQINHKDENKANNMVNNLEWCSRSYNINYGTRNARVAEKEKGRGKPILQFTLDGCFVREWINATTAAKFFGVGNTAISNCLAGRTPTSCGYMWRFKM